MRRNRAKESRRAQVWFWCLGHFGTLGLIATLDEPFRSGHLRTLSLSPLSTTADYLHTATFLCFAACFISLYHFLYASDPCILSCDPATELPVQKRLAAVQPCMHCGSRPSTRSRHSRSLDVCVHKFDHTCWMLSTDIGDRTHGAFGLYAILQVRPANVSSVGVCVTTWAQLGCVLQQRRCS